MSKYTLFWESPIGTLTLEEEDGALTFLLFGRVELPGQEQDTPLLRETVQQLEEYFSGSRQSFTIPLHPSGTPFREKVWAALREIPYGETRSYGQLAEMVGQPRAVRAVGGANHHNPIAILIPCHRVIGADGSLTGYGGGMDKKKFLLRLEGSLL